jgi:hypothetical protein
MVIDDGLRALIVADYLFFSSDYIFLYGVIAARIGYQTSNLGRDFQVVSDCGFVAASTTAHIDGI